jgi:hypothetical protein
MSKRQTPELICYEIRTRICYEIRTRSDACVTSGWHSSAKGQKDNLTQPVTNWVLRLWGAARAILPPSALAGLEFVLFIGLALGISSGFGTYIHMPTPCALA